MADDGRNCWKCVIDDAVRRAHPEVVSDAVVAIYAFPGLQSLDVVGPFEVFGVTNQVLDGTGRPGRRYRPLVATLDGTADVVSENGLVFRPNIAIGALAEIDTLIVPGGNGVNSATDSPEILAALVSGAARSRRRATVCSGAFLGAAAGWFPPGSRVTTHWGRAGQLARRHPELVVDPDPIFIRTGAVWSSAGVTAGIDLALAMVEDDHGAELAQTVAQWLVVFLRRPGGQSQFAAPVWSRPTDVTPVRVAVELIHADPSAALDTVSLAAHAGLSERHFGRVFRRELGTSPARYVEQVRIEAARRLLETEDSGLAAVARRCGFGTDETLRRSFVRRLGVAPDQYRRRFRTPTPITTPAP